MRTLNRKNLLIALMVAVTASACQKSEYRVQEPVGAGANKTETTDLGNGCYLSTFSQPQQEISRKIDLLFVPDTSRSVFKEGAAAAAGIDGFLAALPKEIDFRAGVVLAHGSTSPWTGRLFTSASGEPAVLRSDAHSLDQIRSGLHAKLTARAGDRGSDGGEMGMYSLAATMKTKNLSTMKSQGLYRDDAALAVVFIADENDICATYPKGTTPVPDPNGQEPLVKRRDCKGVSAEGVYSQLRKLKGDMPITLAGIVYTPESRIRTDDRTDEWSVENEIGYGYLDLIRLSNGILIDLAAGKIAEGLSAIGKLAAMKLDLRLEFPIANNMKVKPESVEVKIDSRPTSNFRFESATNQVHLTEGGQAGSKIEIKYCKGL